MSSTRANLATVIGARPQFVKCALVSRALREAGLNELLIHTGQHYDDSMSGVFFRDLDIPRPDFNLNVGSGTHAQQTGAALIGIEEVLRAHPAPLVLVYGDTNSTLAGALAAVKLGIPVAHVESGLRSYNRTMPEEINRVAVDHWSTQLFCHNETTRARLLAENVQGEIHVVGDVMREVMNRFGPKALAESSYPARLDLEESTYAVLTVHRPINSDPAALRQILNWCVQAECPVVFPTHPRVEAIVADLLNEMGSRSDRVRQIAPLGYSDMLALVAKSRLVLTDSGGLQKEAFFLRVPCVTLRSETEWTETLDAGWNVLAGDRPTSSDLEHAFGAISTRLSAKRPSANEHETLLDRLFGPVDPTGRIVETVLRCLNDQ
jgi:UDP-N-acetylglucosamine 2-epimerase